MACGIPVGVLNAGNNLLAMSTALFLNIWVVRETKKNTAIMIMKTQANNNYPYLLIFPVSFNYTRMNYYNAFILYVMLVQRQVRSQMFWDPWCQWNQMCIIYRFGRIIPQISVTTLPDLQWVHSRPRDLQQTGYWPQILIHQTPGRSNNKNNINNKNAFQ